MHGKKFLCLIVLPIIVTIGQIKTGWAASQLILTSPFGNNSYVLQGKDLDGAASMDLTFTYDSSAWSNPRVDQGELISGALTAVNTTLAGTVRVGIVRTTPINGNGNIVTLSFDGGGEKAGGPIRLNARLTGLDGRPIPVGIEVVGPADGPETAGSDQTSSALETRAADAGLKGTVSEEASDSGSVTPKPTILSSPPVRNQPPAYPDTGGVLSSGTVVADDDNMNRRRPGNAEEDGSIASSTESNQGTAGTGRTSKGNYVRAVPGTSDTGIYAPSIIDYFKEYDGERTATAFKSLFSITEFRGFRQEPSIILTEGKDPAEFIVSHGSSAPISDDLSVLGGRLVSMREDRENDRAWNFQIVPEDMPTRLVLPMNNFVIVFPLVHAPKLNVDLDGSGNVTEADFSLFLENGEVSDLNGDGKRDYLDDYLFTANYLVARPDEIPDGGSRAEAMQDGPILQGPEEKLSYAMGMAMGNRFRKQAIMVNPERYLQGLEDVLAGRETLLTQEDAGIVIKEAFQLTRKPASGQPVKVKQATSGLSDIRISFMLDPRLTRGMYMGERWVSPPAFTSAAQTGGELTVQVRAEGLDPDGRAIPIDPEWIPVDPDFMAVSPAKGGKVMITVKKAGESRMKVVAAEVTKELVVKAIEKNNALQVEISQ